MNPLRDYEVRSEDPIETRDDNLDQATQAVNELRTAVEQHRTATGEQITAEVRKLTDRLDAIDLRTQRPGAGGGTEATQAEAAERRQAFHAYLRQGNAAPATELRTLTVSSDPQGGYLAPTEMSSEFIRNLIEFSPIRALASVRQTGAPAVSYPKRNSITNAKWKGETQTQEGSEPTFGQVEIPAREVNTFVDISNQLLADSAGAAEAEVRLALAEDFGQKEGLAFVKGDGVLAPLGILMAQGVTHTPTGNASTLGTAPAEVMIDALYALPAAYRARGTWLMNSRSLAAVRKLKDGQGNFLWQPSYQAGQPETILGRPVVDIPDMDDIGSGTTPIVFGDIATAYRIIDRLALSILVNPYIRATEGITRIHATRRVGGAVVQPAALRKIKCATS